MKRKSNLPMSTVLDVYNNKISTEFLSKNQELIKNIALVSPSLYEMFIKEFNTGKISKKTNFSIMKYIIRMSSRTATFQTFGSVSDENVESEFLSVRLSLKWLLRLKESVELKQKRDSNLIFYVNPELYDKGKYYRMNNYDKNLNKLNEVIILKESLTGKIIEILKSERTEYGSIFNQILKKVGSSKLTHKILLNLIKNNCLTSELNFSSFNPVCSEILYKISKYMEFEDKSNTEIIINMLNDLKKISDLSNSNLLKINRLKVCMNKLLSTEDDIIIERYFESKDAIKDNSKYWEDFHLLRKFNYLTYDYQFIKNFERLFLEKYGFYNEIPLLHVIEDEMFSERKIDKRIKYDQVYKKKKDNYEKSVSRLIVEFSLNNKVIPLLKISELLEPENNIFKYYKIDIDIKYKEIFEKKYVPADSIVFPAGSFSSKYKFLKNDKKLKEPFYRFDYMLNYAPDIGVNYNKDNANNISIRDNYISDDIVIGVDHDGIYIKSINKSKKIIPVYQSLAKLNFVAESYLARFLRRMSEYICLPPKHYLTEKYLNFPHIPRVEHNGIILFKESWNMCIDSTDENILKSYIKNFIDDYRIPNNVAILESGNEFPILVNTELGFKILINQLKKSKNVTLVEYPELYYEDYMVEFIDNITQGDIVYSDVLEEKSQHCNRVSNDYITYILILQTTHIENEALHKIFSFLTEENYKFFFIRYAEEGERSLRIRIRISPEVDESKLFKFFQKMFTDNILKKFYTDNYKPEYNRYGLYEMKLAEEIFELDSIFAIENLYKSKIEDKYIIYIILSTLVNNYGDIIDCLEFLERNFPESYNNKIKSTYSKNREYYNNIYSILENNQIKEIFPELPRKISNYFSHIRNNYSKKRCDYMVRSIIHMRINRNIGIVDEEDCFYYYAKYIIKRKVFIDKFKGK